MPTARTVTVYGASGHTGRFVVAELCHRGWLPVLAGRDAARLDEVAALHPGLDVRPASVDDAASLDRAVAGAAAVVNCAGPFAVTAAPVIEAALRARVPYLDVAAEADVVAGTFERFDGPARAAGVVVAPALAFFGGLGDLLATAAMGDWDRADRIHLAYALSGWKPTRGTLATGELIDVRRGAGAWSSPTVASTSAPARSRPARGSSRRRSAARRWSTSSSRPTA
jgi:saccharopine dehydrogenase-like NADP-dependent oxidoreductase